MPAQQLDGMANIQRNRLTFKDLDGIRKVADLPLPVLLKFSTGSCEAVLLRVSRNNGFGYVPINEYIRDRQTIWDKCVNNGLFLNFFMTQIWRRWYIKQQFQFQKCLRTICSDRYSLIWRMPATF